MKKKEITRDTIVSQIEEIMARDTCERDVLKFLNGLNENRILQVR